MGKIDKEYIENRVKDWKERLAELYKNVEQALSDHREIAYKKDRMTTMNEELMQKFDVHPEQIPLLDIYKNDVLIATFKPIGLWVIGANGRVDILTKKGSYIVVDTSDKGAAPSWKVYTPENRKQGIELDKNFLEKIINEV